MIDWILACWWPPRILPNIKMINGLMGLIEYPGIKLRFPLRVWDAASVFGDVLDNLP